MMKLLRSNERAESILEIDFEALRSLGKTTLLFDLDNTLARRRCRALPACSLSLLSQLEDSGFRIGILTNRRVRRPVEGVDIPILYHARKPHRRGYRLLLNTLAASAGESVMIGDRVLTDILGANRLGVHSILVEGPPSVAECS
jgi:uncharacterized protein